MNKRFLVFTGTVALATVLTVGSVFAAGIIKLKIDGNEVKTTIPLQNTKGGITGPVRQIAEELGANVYWNSKSQSVDITNAGRIRAEQLERALIPTDKYTAAKLWAESAKTRNGALQYAILSPELKQKLYNDYKAWNWVIGASSPWVDSYEITEKPTTEADTVIYEIKYVWTDSTGSKTNSAESITVRKFNNYGTNNWLVVKTDGMGK